MAWAVQNGVRMVIGSKWLVINGGPPYVNAGPPLPVSPRAILYAEDVRTLLPQADTRTLSPDPRTYIYLVPEPILTLDIDPVTILDVGPDKPVG